MERALDDFLSGFPLMPFGRRSLEADPWRRLRGAVGSGIPSVDDVLTFNLPKRSEAVRKGKRIEITSA